MKEKNILRYPPFNVDANVIDSDDGRYYDDDGGNSNEERFLASQDALKVTLLTESESVCNKSEIELNW